ncbi:MAG: hypothetical protein NTZ25_03065 [Candidatus Peregrinibacteria bacterium]|nr:hypothetical protein [Candidatus Peregrinibacteria bacterium]
MKKFLVGVSMAVVLSGCSSASFVPQKADKTDAKSIVSFVESNLNNQKLGVTFAGTKSDDFVWWIASDNKNILVKDAFATSSSVPVTALEMNATQKADFEKKFNSMAYVVDQSLTKNGFTKNALNSSDSLGDGKFYDYVAAYEKSPTVCTLSLNGDVGGNEPNFSRDMVFSCSDQFQKYYDEQVPFLNAFYKTNKSLFTGEYAVTDIKKIGEFAVVNLGARRTGLYSIFKKVNGKYQSIFSGQEAPSCKLVTQYKIPKEITKTCWSDDGLTEKEIK